MSLVKCKNCQNEVILEPNKDYQYQFDIDSPLEVIDVEICPICKCIYWENETHTFFEYEKHIGDGDTSNAIGGWVTNKSVLINN